LNQIYGIHFVWLGDMEVKDNLEWFEKKV